jgi:hypothetical protein
MHAHAQAELKLVASSQHKQLARCACHMQHAVVKMPQPRQFGAVWRRALRQDKSNTATLLVAAEAFVKHACMLSTRHRHAGCKLSMRMHTTQVCLILTQARSDCSARSAVAAHALLHQIKATTHPLTAPPEDCAEDTTACARRTSMHYLLWLLQHSLPQYQNCPYCPLLLQPQSHA